MQAKEKFLEEVRSVLDAVAADHATTFEDNYCFDSIVDDGHSRFAIKVSVTIDNVDTQARQELQRICPLLRCTPIIIGERTRKRPLQDGVVHTRGNVSAINLETFRNMLEKEVFPYICTKKGGIFVMIDGQKLKEARKALSYSRGAVAEVVGISRRAIYEYERGTMSPTIDVALQLEEMLDTQLIKPINLLQSNAAPSQLMLIEGHPLKRSWLAVKAFEMLSRLGLSTTMTQDTPFDILAALPHNVILTCLKPHLEHLDEERLAFLSELANVLKEHPAIIASEQKSTESIQGIPVFNIKELVALRNPKDLVAMIRQRRGA